MNSLEIVLEWLLVATVRASALAAIILVCQRLMRSQMSAQWRYALWLPMLLVLVLPVLPAAPFGMFPWKSTESVTVERRDFANEDVLVVGKSSAITAAGAQEAAVNPFAVTWLIGACGVFAAGWIGYRRSMRRIVKNAVTPEESLLDWIKIAALETGVRRVPQVIVSPAVDSPAVTGIFRPALLLPAHFPNGFSDEETRLILLHELTHLKRQDLAVNGLACVLQALHWFNPILWFAFARMRTDREAACDASVLSMGKDDRRAIYGGALLKLEGGFSPRGLSLGFVGMFERSTGMKSRIREISSHSSAKRSGWAVGLSLIALLVTFGATKAEEPVPQEAVKKAVQEPMSEGVAYISKKLDSIVIPRIDAENATLEGIVDFVTLRAKQFDDAEKDPAKKGINFVIRRPRGGGEISSARITFQKKNVFLREAVREIAKQAGVTYKVDDFALTFIPLGELNTENAVKVEPAPMLNGKAADFAIKLIIPQTDFDQTTLRKAVDALNQKARELTKDGPVYPIVIGPSVDPNAKLGELRIRNAPLMINLKYYADQVKCILTADDKEIRISRP